MKKELSKTPLLTVPQVAEILSVHEETVRRYVHRNILTAIRLSGKAIRIHPDDLQEFLERHRREED